MSRPYRIRVKHSIRRVIRAEDSVTSTLEILPILESDELATLLATELEANGYERDGKVLRRRIGSDAVEINPETGEVKVTVGAKKQLNLQNESTASTYEIQERRQVEERIRRQLKGQLDREASEEEAELKAKVVDRMDGVLQELQPELDRIINRVTAEALKTKAGRMGAIKEIQEDEGDGSLTIVVEV